MSEILDCNVSVVEDLHKNREPLPLVAVYFVQPTTRNVDRILADFPEGEKALYQSVHIFFSSQVGLSCMIRNRFCIVVFRPALGTFAFQVRPKLVEKIKGCSSLIRNIKALKESNLEFLLVDSRTVTTEHPDALAR